MVYRSEDVHIVLSRKGGMDINIWPRRNRKDFRSRLVALGGTETPSGHVVGLRGERLDEAQQIIAEEYPNWVVRIRDERAVQKRPGDRIRWADEAGGFSSTYHNGYVGDVKLFVVISNYRYNDPEKYKLHTELPGYPEHRHHGILQRGTQEAAEEAAEEILAEFLGKLGATWKEEI